MGEVKEAVQGTPLATDDNPSGQNLVERVHRLRDEVSRHITVKDHDVLTEGPANEAENRRKAGVLRAAHSLLLAAEKLLDSYAP